jgi:SepF-like predicted cell division protein (DUF552 family)
MKNKMYQEQIFKIEIPSVLRDDRYRFVKLGKQCKTPFENVMWSNQNERLKWNDKALQEHIEQGFNYGVIAGEGNIVIVDIDKPELFDKKTIVANILQEYNS